MIRTENQQTFMSYGELLSRSAQRCLEAERSIRHHIDTIEPPHSKAMEQIADAEHRLAMDLAAYAEKGPENIVCTRVQFTLDENVSSEAENLTEALHNVTGINNRLAEVLVEEADKVTLDALRDTLEMLDLEIESVNRQISMIRLTANDI
ncbi:MAG: hypothetical protein V2I26_08790 [Halieaceae bacterium]|jgi:hypothetical protein|nr:hypothetical protein [Halieaceae bacterium]